MRRRHVWLVIVALTGTACGTSTGQPKLTDEERKLLSGYAMGNLPASPTNAYADNEAAVALGQQFFFELRFSGKIQVPNTGINGNLGELGETGKMSCASCHDLVNGGADTRSKPNNVSLGSKWTPRNAMSFLNLPYTTFNHWDGRKDTLWSGNLGPAESPASCNGSRLQIAHVIFDLYRAPYEAIFGAMPDLSDTDRFPATGRPGDASWAAVAPDDQVAVNRIFANYGKAIEAYERKLISANSAFDKYMAGDETALSPAAIRGAKLFVGRASCNECHRGPLFSDGKFHNLGIPQTGWQIPRVDQGRYSGIPQLLADPFRSTGVYSDDTAAGAEMLKDVVAGQPQDLGAFKTASLRNVSKTAPYMHTGGFSNLWDVVAFYRQGGGTDNVVGTKDPAIKPLNLSDSDLDDLVAFLNSLEGAPLPSSLTTSPVLP